VKRKNATTNFSKTDEIALNSTRRTKKSKPSMLSNITNGIDVDQDFETKFLDEMSRQKHGSKKDNFILQPAMSVYSRETPKKLPEISKGTCL
jgi:hypothetical protein